MLNYVLRQVSKNEIILEDNNTEEFTAYKPAHDYNEKSINVVVVFGAVFEN